MIGKAFTWSFFFPPPDSSGWITFPLSHVLPSSLRNISHDLQFLWDCMDVLKVIVLFVSETDPELEISKYMAPFKIRLAFEQKIPSHSFWQKMIYQDCAWAQLNWGVLFALTQTLPLCTDCTEGNLSPWPSQLRAIFRVPEWTSCPALSCFSLVLVSGTVLSKRHIKATDYNRAEKITASSRHIQRGIT